MTNKRIMIPEFYRCSLCGNLVEMIAPSGAKMKCCGKEMELLIPGSADGDPEAHVPVWRVDETRVQVTVGTTHHPMMMTHYIMWVELVTNRGIQRKWLNPGEPPTASFIIGATDKILGVFAYCNIHGLYAAFCDDVEDHPEYRELNI